MKYLNALVSIVSRSDIIRKIIQTACNKMAILCMRLFLIYMLAHIFTPSEFGAYSIITVFYTFFMIISGLNLSTFLARVVPGQNVLKGAQVFKVTFLFEIGLTLVFVVIIFGSGLMQSLLLVFKILAYKKAFIIGLLLIVTSTALAELNAYLLAKTKITHNNKTEFIAQAIWVVPLIFLWLIGIHLTVVDVLLANLIGILLSIIYGFLQVEIKEWWYAPFDFKTLSQAIKYSVPLIIPAALVTVLRTGDRFILAHYHNLHDVGVYSLAFTFINTLYTFSAGVIFCNMVPYVVQAHNLDNIKDRNVILLDAYRSALIMFVATGLVFMLFPKPIFELMARSEYLEARQVLPLLYFGTLNIILNYPSDVLLSLQNRTMLVMWIDSVCLVIGLSLDFLLIPKYSYHGAALTMFITFGLIAAIKAFYARLWEHINFMELLFLREGKVFLKKGIDKIKIHR